MRCWDQWRPWPGLHRYRALKLVLPPWCWRACCAPRPEFHRRMQTRHSLWPSREPTRQGSRYPFTGIFAGEARSRISLPGYPFQRERYWVEPPKRRRTSADHLLLGNRHESASGEITFDTEVFPSDPKWLGDHRVYNQLVVPGALFGSMAAEVSTGEGAGLSVVEDMQLHNPLIFPEQDSEDEANEEGRNLQLLLDDPRGGGETPYPDTEQRSRRDGMDVAR